VVRKPPRWAAASEESGFTIMELLIAVIIIGILVTIAFPSYLTFKLRANDSAAQSNVSAAVPAVTAYGADNDGSATDKDSDAATSGYQGMTLALLQTYDAGVKNIAIGTVSTTSYCVSSTVGVKVWRKNGPSAALEGLAC